MASVEARQKIKGDSYQLPREKSECLPQPPKTPKIPLVVIERSFGRIEVGAIVGTGKSRFRKDRSRIEVIAGARTGEVVEERNDRLQIIGSREPPRPEPTPKEEGVSIDY